jgi:transcriptional regulator with XRE-family HTH domain
MARHKEEAYEQAVLFRKRGFTYAEIAKICNVSRGTISNWLAHEDFSQNVAVQNKKRAVAENTKRLASINKACTTERKRQYEEITRSAQTEYKHYRHNPLFIAGLTLYLAEGDVTSSTNLLRLTNSRAELHKLFIRFLTEYMAVDKKTIRFWLLLYPDHDEVACMKHWCKKTTLSPAQFYKNQYIQSRSQKKSTHYGVGNTVVASVLLKKKLLYWVSLLEKDVSK